VKLAITLPSFSRDPEVPIGLAQAAESAGLDGAFVFDHLFRRGAGGTRRPALEGTTLLAAVAASTTRISVGTLVARAALRPPAVLAAAFETAARVAPGRVVAGIGAGDSESREEMEAFGLEFGTVEHRLNVLRMAVRATRARGVPVWVGGAGASTRAVAAELADGWNLWAELDQFAARVGEVRAAAGGRAFTVSWAGLTVIGATAAEVAAKTERLQSPPGTLVGTPAELAAILAGPKLAGADWVVLGPVDSTDPANTVLLGEVVARLRS
jgi:alkanesulfonate monooxygenase SsuD/methylene tetrahydromethanopterin reductase-like flavin-dependent oxidoreductase (luciferase family)